MIWDEAVLERALQNHLLQVRHFATELVLWMPQYLPSNIFVRPYYSRHLVYQLTRKHVAVEQHLPLLWAPICRSCRQLPY